MSAKMTPGPWHDCENGRIGTGTDSRAGHICRWVASAEPKDARAIACLPELVEEAQHLLKLLDGLGVLTPERNALRRILARIDGED